MAKSASQDDGAALYRSSTSSFASTSAEEQQETSRLARLALKAQDKALQFLQAAVAAGDPQERQKLLNQALQAEIEAESFGKTAKWLSSGTAQGLIAGTSIGSIPGVSLGVITGTLVGGLTTLVTGGLGGAIGAGVGALHGPFWKLGDIAGGALQKVLPTIPGWTATSNQRRALERLLGFVKDQEQPSPNELRQLAESSMKRESRQQSRSDNAPLRAIDEMHTKSSIGTDKAVNGQSYSSQHANGNGTARKKRPRKLERRMS